MVKLDYFMQFLLRQNDELRKIGRKDASRNENTESAAPRMKDYESGYAEGVSRAFIRQQAYVDYIAELDRIRNADHNDD